MPFAIKNQSIDANRLGARGLFVSVLLFVFRRDARGVLRRAAAFTARAAWEL